MAMSLGCPKQILHAHGIEADRTQMLGGHETGKPGTTTNGGLSLGPKPGIEADMDTHFESAE